ncbi:hypothetical protein ANCDUO_17424 [Ancylostoma duodenale]|uniref:Uncharacterized protein n=1 Tax=Ancylostoma duodenale TaxID=51022 RepID=A0A0C2FV91_9BILA|nr:hypothetical protein ANCDUO_17424 [Ancylostoma duodenale]
METRPETLPRIIEYGRSEGILQVSAPNNAFNITGIVLAAQEEAHTQKETKTGDKASSKLLVKTGEPSHERPDNDARGDSIPAGSCRTPLFVPEHCYPGNR